MNATIVQTVTFGRDGNAKVFQMSGWSQPETEFTWSIGTECELALPALDAPAGFSIELTCVIFQPLTLEVRVNETAVASCVIEASGTFVWQAPPTQGPVPIRLTFHHPNAQRPCDLLDSTDSRALGLRCHRLRLVRWDKSGTPPAAGEPSDHELAMAFRSLGDGCEFGLVQRALGAEPLGLLRWSEAPLAQVTRGIETGWDTLGDHLAVAVEGGEWMTRDHGYGLRRHAFIAPDGVGREALLIKEQKKTAFLRRLLIEEVANADRIFVVSSPDGPASVEQVVALHIALNRDAPNWLLWVTADGEPGSVETIAPRLMRGHISRFLRQGVHNDYVLADWTVIMRTAWRFARGDISAGHPMARVPDAIADATPEAAPPRERAEEAEIPLGPWENESDIGEQTLPTLASLERIYRDEPLVHQRIYDACDTAMARDTGLRGHREYVEQNKLGFGDRAFHWLWKLIVDAMPSQFKFLEIGVYKGQVTSLLGMLALAAGKTVENLGVTPLGAFGDKFSNYEDVDYLAAIRSIEVWCGIPEENRARIVRGFSDDDEVKRECRAFAPFDLVYIDGCHDYDVVVNDINTYGDMLKSGGLLVMDDASTELRLPRGIWPGHADVGRAVREVLEPMHIFARVGSVGHLRVWRKQ